MLKTIIFKFILLSWFVLWTPLLIIGLISSKLEHMFILSDAWGVLFIARIIGGIKYKIHYPPVAENGIPFQHNINTRLDGRAIIASKHSHAAKLRETSYEKSTCPGVSIKFN